LSEEHWNNGMLMVSQSKFVVAPLRYDQGTGTTKALHEVSIEINFSHPLNPGSEFNEVFIIPTKVALLCQPERSEPLLFIRG